MLEPNPLDYGPAVTNNIPILGVATLALLFLAMVGARNEPANARPPELKEGLWLVRTRILGGPGRNWSTVVFTLCRDHAYDRRAQALAKRLLSTNSGCTKVTDSLRGYTYSVATRCSVGGIVVDSRSVTVYRPDSIHTETHQSYLPPLEGVAETTLIEDQQYLDRCPEGSKPGDTMRADGTEQK
jgi:hypothetical protein